MNNNIREVFAIANNFLTDVTRKISDVIEEVDTVPARNILKYALSQNGQMIRPSLIYITACAHKSNIDETLHGKLVLYASAIELIHTASLVHDDIIDSTEERRGMKSVCSFFGNNNAILAGNIFYLTAFDITNKYLSQPQVDSIVRAATDMCCGEVVQFHYTGRKIPHDTYFDITEKKTASLIKHACGESARLGGMPPDTVVKMQILGDSFGKLYQLYDDYKDQDVNLESGFDFVYEASYYIMKAEQIINGLDESIYKKTFKGFVEFFKNAFNTNPQVYTGMHLYNISEPQTIV